MTKFKNTLRKAIPTRLRYGRAYHVEKKISSISPSYNVKEYHVNYLKSINKLYSVVNLEAKSYLIKQTNFKKLKNKDSRDLLVRGVYSLFKSFKIPDELVLKKFPKKTKKERELLINEFSRKKHPQLSSEVLEKIYTFLNTRKKSMQPKYLTKFAEIFYELNLLKEQGALVVEGNKFFLEVFSKLNHIVKQELSSHKITDSTPAYDYLSLISSGFIDFVVRSKSNQTKKYATVNEFKKEKFSLDKIKNYTVR